MTPEVEVLFGKINESYLEHASFAVPEHETSGIENSWERDRAYHDTKGLDLQGPSYSNVQSAPPSTTLSSLCSNASDVLLTAGNLNLNLNLNLTDCGSNAITPVIVSYRHPLLGALLTLFALVTVLGNILVIIAVARERYLRSVTNYFIVSLAIADFIIGAVVMPFSISLEVTSQLWLFGSDWCDVWHSFDVLASTASILNLSVISLDRYWAITDPFAYPRKMSTGRAMVLIALVWICSAAISFPAILWWRAVATEHIPDHMCFFTEDSGYLIFSSIVSFYVPISVILYAYYRIYKAASEQMQSLKTGTKVMHSNGMNGEAMTLRMHRGGGGRLNSEANIQYSRTSLNSDSDNESPSHLLRHHLTLSSCDGPNDIRPSRMISRKWRNFAISRKLSKLAKEQKAAKTLGIVMGVFCICWVPFFVSNVLYGICKLDCIYKAEIIFPIFTWLGYINSGMNPIIYACSMRDFRRAFARILCCCCPNHFHVSRRHTNMTCETSFSTSSFYVSSGCGDRYSNVRL